MANNQLSDIFSILSKLSGASGEQKKNTADSIMASMSEKDNMEFQNIINDKSKVEEILASPAVKQIIEKINGQHK